MQLLRPQNFNAQRHESKSVRKMDALDIVVNNNDAIETFLLYYYMLYKVFLSLVLDFKMKGKSAGQ